MGAVVPPVASIVAELNLDCGCWSALDGEGVAAIYD